MSDRPTSSLNRRDFVKTGAAAGAAGAALTSTAIAQDADKKADDPVLMKRPLGKTGVDVTIVNHGTWQAPGALERLVRNSYSKGVRFYDTAQSYGSEPGIKRWLDSAPGTRDQIFLATKHHVDNPKEMLAKVDERCAALGVDHLDLLYFHAVGDHDFAKEVEWPRSKEMKEVVETIKKTGKVKFVGISTHHGQRAQILQHAAEGGFLDVVMLQYTPWLDANDDLNKAIDACHDKGIGLISMKQLLGQFLGKVYDHAPVLKERGITPHQGLLQAIWSDERIATVCVSMHTLEHVRENVEAARKFEPLTKAEIKQIRDSALSHGPVMCADCDGRCSRAAGTQAALGELTRFLAYAEHTGLRAEARRLYAELADHQKNWNDADLDAARHACPNRLDFTNLMDRVKRTLA